MIFMRLLFLGDSKTEQNQCSLIHKQINLMSGSFLHYVYTTNDTYYDKVQREFTLQLELL